MKSLPRFVRLLLKAVMMALVMGSFFWLVGLSISALVLVLGSPLGWLLKFAWRPAGLAVTRWTQTLFFWSWFVLGGIGFVVGAWFGFTAAIRHETQEQSLRTPQDQ